MGNRKFMQSVSDKTMRRLEREGKNRGDIPIQEVLRAVIIPEWIRREKAKKNGRSGKLHGKRSLPVTA